MSKRLRAALLVCMLFCVTLLGAVFAACTPTDKKPDDGKEPETPVEGVYSVTVKDSEGNPMSGIQVQMCDTNNLCLLAVTTDENGVAEIQGAEEGMTYHIRILNWSTVTAEYPDASYDEITTTAGVYAYTLVVTLGEKVEEPEAVSYTFTVVDDAGAPVKGVGFMIQLGTFVTGVTDAEGKAVLTLPAGTEILAEGYPVSITVPTGYFYPGKTLNTNDENKTVTIVKGAADLGSRRTVYNLIDGERVQQDMYFIDGVDGKAEYDIYALSEEEIFYTFQTNTSGKYSIYVEGGDATITEYATYNSGTNAFYYNVVDENKDMESFDFEINKENAANINSSFQTFGVKLTADSYPARAKLVVERTGEAAPPPQHIDKGVVEAEQVPAEKYAEQDGVLITVNALGTPDTLVLGTDGYYHLGTAAGPVVVAKITGASRFISDGRDLVNVEVSGNKLLHPSYLVDGNYYDYDYTKFVQAYTNVVNSDGVVPLTEEFADFLKDYAERAGYPEAPEDPYAEAIEGYGWYLFLYYYDAEVKDFEEGKGTEADPYVISETGVYGHTLTLNDQTYVFVKGFCSWNVEFAALGEGGMDVAVNGATLGQYDYSVVTTPSEVFDGEYGFMLEIIYGSRITDAPDTIDIEFTVVSNPSFGIEGYEHEVYLGSNYIEAHDAEFLIKFTAPYTGKYTFDATSGGLIANATIEVPEEETFEAAKMEFEMEMGQTYTFALYGAGHESHGFVFDLVISFEADPIEGTGTVFEPFIIPGEGTYTITVPAGGVQTYFKISGSDAMYIFTEDEDRLYENVTYNNNSFLSLGGFYTNAAADQMFILSSEEGYMVTIGVEKAPAGTEVNPVKVDVGTFDVTMSSGIVGTFVSFTAPEAGTYTIYSDEELAFVQVGVEGMPEGQWDGYYGFNLAFEAAANDTIIFVIKSDELGIGEISFKTTIMKGERSDDDRISEESGSDYETGDPADSDLETGENTVTSGGFVDNLMTFIPAEAGTYTFSTTDEAAVLMVVDDSGATAVIDPMNGGSSSYTVTLGAKQVLTLSISDANWNDTYSWTLTITKKA